MARPEPTQKELDDEIRKIRREFWEIIRYPLAYVALVAVVSVIVSFLKG